MKPHLAYTPVLSALLFTTSALAQSHAKHFIGHIQAIANSLDCNEASAICKEKMRRARRTSCYPPMVQLSIRTDVGLEVQARIFVSSDGRVSEVKITKPSPLEGLNSAAVESMRECQFPKLLKDGEPIGSSFLVTWIFSDGNTAIQVSE